MRKKHILKKLCLPFAFAAILIIGCIWQSVMVKIETDSTAEIGTNINVGTYQAHCYLQGEGELVFVFITGSGTPCAYTDFYELQNALSAMGQTVSFDHAGSGWSTQTESPRTVESLVNELSILVDTVAQNKPVILICHSLGALEAIGYAQMNPDRVRGIVFLDSGSPEFYSSDSELTAKAINRGTAFLRITGVNRLLGELGVFLPIYGENIRNDVLPQDIKKTDKALFYRLAGNSASLNTIELMNENAAAVMRGPSLGALPILVLSSDHGQEWHEVQLQLASWSEKSRQVTIEESEHYLHWSDSQKVLRSIEAFAENILDT